ncbi:rRNA cytosine-C5-methyltransferase [Cohnella pontilimi]|uniref:rRNA cytosine-C5-methyltransferase n=1 Tax=Cohnella pontilimi TaxID=2564100 RepID=A0A4U0F9Q5_9BACL|nr:RsmB/NOP family class I SAM-dependent RNA methyltransferase [Cohnella pontilimi]TJY41371.1 rRNA cytosine-C5-methyltransferase [Cohnella pontilimi]
MKLPEGFVSAMRDLLQEEAESFFASYDKPKTSGLRANGLKLSGEELAAISEYARTAVPWAEGAFYTEEDDRPGKHPHYHLGVYYIQEPSAMLPAELLGVEPGHRVLDLCAAPGGKSTQLAAKLQGKGVLVTNDNASERTKALAKNVELAGVRNTVVLNEEPAAIADHFGAWFDRVLVDAPCSGEGMFRKDEDMLRQYERLSADGYAAMQQDILQEAARLVAPGGRLVYSTCTFNARENEGTIAKFIAAFPEFEVVAPAFPESWGFAPGRPDWLIEDEKRGLSEERAASLAGAVRLWPHRVRGEGHFAVLLERRRSDSDAGAPQQVQQMRGLEAGERKSRKAAHNRVQISEADVLDKFEQFRADQLPHWHPPGKLLVRGTMLYAQPEPLPMLDGLHVIRPGWLLGTATKHRFEPSQALAMGLACGQAVRLLQLASDSSDSLRYLKGETLQPQSGAPEGKGWTLVCMGGFPAGWGRWDGTTLKNERLPGWRWV